MRTNFFLPAAGLLLFLLMSGVDVYSRSLLRKQVAAANERESILPQRILWAWDRPEDLHGVDPAETGVAVLEETLRIGASVRPMVRHQPVIVRDNVGRIAVVRIETDQAFAAHRNDGAVLDQTVSELQRLSRVPGIAAFQIDFDAKKSERGFYRRLLTELRRQMPPGLPLDITALVSWCSTDDWMGDLPINAATPMFFRMEPDRRRLRLSASSDYQLREPLCAGSIGLSTTERWPEHVGNKRVFLFSDRGWTRDLAILGSLPVHKSQPVPQQP